MTAAAAALLFWMTLSSLWWFIAFRRGRRLEKIQEQTSAVVWKLRGDGRLTSKEAGEILTSLWGV